MPPFPSSSSASSVEPVRIDLAQGLTEFPRKVFDHADTLEVLNLTGNRLSSLPDDLGRLKKLRILFCSNNDFTRLPAVLGSCPSLTMVGFRANRIEMIEPGAFPSRLQWLILTENRLAEIPATLGRCTGLRKLMLSGNLLSTLPVEMAACQNLELLRLAANRFENLPGWLLKMPRLAWLALAGNPCNSRVNVPRPGSLNIIPWGELELQQRLGEGASGIIHQAFWHGGHPPGPVAVKVFKGSMTSDGLPSSEMDASLAVGEHPHLTKVVGKISSHPDGAEGLVMELIDPGCTPLAAPPSFESCTRDVYPSGRQMSAQAVVRVAHGVASAAAQLHAHGILHGDLYAHNILYRPDGRCLLSDFGAAAFYERSGSVESARLEQIEVRAFGLLLEELLALLPDVSAEDLALGRIRQAMVECLQQDVDARPSFQELQTRLGGTPPPCPPTQA